jgi:glycosyltransferase involved in cell wall biosynthesis
MGLDRCVLCILTQREPERGMRVLMYTHRWAPSIGGVESITKSLADGLSERSRNHPAEALSITLLTQTPKDTMDDSLLAYRVIRTPNLGEWIRRIRSTDIVHLAGPSMLPLALAWLLHKPVVLQHHGYQSICPNGLLLQGRERILCPGHFMAKRYQRCLECNKAERGWVESIRNLLLTFPRRWLARRATVNVGVSPHVAQRVMLPRTRVIWNGVPTPEAIAFVSKTPSACSPVCFAYLGRLVAEKGVSVLLHACKELAMEKSDFRVKIIGDGPERRNLEAMTEELKLGERIEFTGFMTGAAIAKSMADVVAVVMPSIWEEVSPLAAMEQMMDGRLLIASDIGGLGLVVDNVGLKFPAGDSKALASCMRQVLQNPPRATALGLQGRLRAVQTFARNRMVEEYINLYRTLVRT